MAHPGSYKVCPRCNTAMDIQTQSCSVCGHQFQTQFAPPPNQTQAFYGTPQANPNWAPYMRNNQVVPDSNRLLITILLWFFLGHFGAHRFYLGYPATAATMLGLELLGIATACIFIGYLFLLAVVVWWIVDLVQILTGNLRPIDGGRLV